MGLCLVCDHVGVVGDGKDFTVGCHGMYGDKTRCDVPAHMETVREGEENLDKPENRLFPRRDNGMFVEN